MFKLMISATAEEKKQP